MNNTPYLEEQEKSCPHCSSPSIKKDGTRKTTMGKKQKWMCKDCGKRFILEPVSNIKGDIEAITLSMDLYIKGMSYRSIQDTLRQFKGLSVDHTTIMRWVHDFMDKINKYVSHLHPDVGDNWLADEQFTKIKGDLHYIWNCMDEETRFLLANHVSPARKTVDARKLFQDAKKTAQKKAKTITTDGAFAYNKAVTKEFYTYANQKPHRRYVSIRQERGNNNRIERYHGTFRHRDKGFRGHDNPEGTEAFSKNFRTFYNFVRPHEALNGQTPAQAVGV
ncbi:MAG: IS6 family transposase [bacterium]|nr:IS6 family transposase [bacterium]